MTHQVGPMLRRAPELVPAALLGLVLLATADRYGPHGDELYFRMLPVRFAYTDQPPVTVWLAALSRTLSDALWVQRLPAVVAAGAGVLLAAQFPRALGAGPGVASRAAWGHATAVYPLVVGHVMLTNSLDLVVWMAVALCVLRAATHDRRWLVIAGVVAGIGCWNKLLILVYVAALGIGLLLTRPRLVATRYTVLAVLVLGAVAAPQLAYQIHAGLPMRDVSAALVQRQGTRMRLLMVPATFVFLGPPWVLVWWRALTRERRGAGAFLLPAAVVVAVWALAFPAQPHYVAPALLPALAVGWVHAGDLFAAPGRFRLVVAVNALLVALMCLPVVPPTSRAFSAVSVLNPTAADQVGWAGDVRHLAVAGPHRWVLAQDYQLAGAVARYGPGTGLRGVSSGTNALWELGPPPDGVPLLLVGRFPPEQRRLFAGCRDVGRLHPASPDRLEGLPLLRCDGPRDCWDRTWPALRRFGL